ncbi:hypothetical protein HY947_04705 [Candidatus Gottesmanbacteria bacterium]|nr:hypothetical protein [Candidatus Gottesmanbacteria bacterium]
MNIQVIINHSIKKVRLLVLLMGISLFAGVCISLRNYFPIPNTNFFAYAKEGNEYLSGKIPELVKLPPVYSILITIPGLFIHSDYIQLKTAVMMNIVLITSSFLLIYVYLKKIDTQISLPITCLLMSNFLSFIVALQPINTAAFVFLFMVALTLDIYKKKRLPMIIAGIGYLVRPESIVLLCTLFVKNLVLVFLGHNKIQKTKEKIILFTDYFFISLTPFVIWEAFAYYHNAKANDYFLEIARRINEIPNWSFLVDSEVNYLFYTLALPKIIVLSFMIVLVSICTILLIRGKFREIATLLLFSLLYAAIHVFFPVASGRYSYVLLLINYVLLFVPILYLHTMHHITSHQKSILIVLLTFFLLYVNVRDLPQGFAKEKKYREEALLLIEYLRSNNFTKQTVILIPEPWIAQYFNQNTKVSVVSAPINCISLSCLTKDNAIQSAEEVLVALDSYTSRALGKKYFKNFPHAKFFEYFDTRLSASMVPIYSATLNDSWIRIYQLSSH